MSDLTGDEMMKTKVIKIGVMAAALVLLAMQSHGGLFGR